MQKTRKKQQEPQSKTVRKFFSSGREISCFSTNVIQSTPNILRVAKSEMIFEQNSGQTEQSTSIQTQIKIKS